MTKSTHSEMRSKRKALIGKIVCIWVVVVLLVAGAVVYDDYASKAQQNTAYSIIEDEATALAEFSDALWNEDALVAVLICVLAIVALVLLILTLSQRKDKDGNVQNQKQRELKAHRIDVGAVVGNQDVSDLEDVRLEDDEVTLSRTVKVLLVEDNQINMDVAQYMLEEAGIIVHLAKDGKEAVEMFESLPAEEIDVILMDVMMPVMDGIEATKVIRSMEKENSKTIPIIALTASQNEDDIQRTKDAGMNEYMSKPFDIGITLSTINKYIK